MLEPWNDPFLLPPPNNTCLNIRKVDISDLKHSCTKVKDVLAKQAPLHKESALLSRFIYKFDKKFRNDIGYRYFKKVNSALHKYLKINLLNDIENFMAILPGEGENYLPTGQMLQYLMVRIISFSLLMKRICVCSKQAAVYYMDRIKRGESHWMSLMPFALLCRIWSLSLILLQHSSSWYSQKHNYLNKLELKGLEFLPAGYILPKDLAQWLDISNLDSCTQFKWFCKKNVHVTLDFVDEEEKNFDSILDYVKDINNTAEQQEQQECHTENKKPLVLFANTTIKSNDEGQKISREHFQSFFNTEQDKITTHDVSKVTNKMALDTFIADEDKFRNQDSKQSLTRHLSFMQWQSLKTNLLQLSDSLSKNRKIERKFQKLWKEKCLDYLN